MLQAYYFAFTSQSELGAEGASSKTSTTRSCIQRAWCAGALGRAQYLLGMDNSIRGYRIVANMQPSQGWEESSILSIRTIFVLDWPYKMVQYTLESYGIDQKIFPWSSGIGVIER